MAKQNTWILTSYFIFSGALFLGGCFYFIADGKSLSSLLPKPARKFPAIGLINNVEGDTRVRSAGELLWIPGHDNDVIHENDLVFTGADGQLNVLIPPNTKLRVHKDSLFKISLKDHMITIELRQGELSSASEGKETIQVTKDGKAKILKLAEFETKVTSEALDGLTAPSHPAFSVDLQDALDDVNDADVSSVRKADLASPTEHQQELESMSPYAQAEFSALKSEENQKIFWLLGLSYTIFSLVALKEFVRSRKLSSPLS